MDLAAESTRLRLDVLAVALGRRLDEVGVPYALIKGPSTSLWLYDPPRRYSDVDLLVPHSQVDHARRALSDVGLASSRSGRAGEEAPHSLLMHSREGFEVDLHLSLPLVTGHDRVWEALSAHLEPLRMDVGAVTSLDLAGRCLVLALHAVANPGPGQATDDLQRALDRTEALPGVWSEVHRLAHALEVDDLVAAGVASVTGEEATPSRRARMHLSGAPAVALGLQRLADTPWRRRPAAVWREIFPSRGFLAHAGEVPDLHGRDLARAHLRRWRRIAKQIPSALRIFRQV